MDSNVVDRRCRCNNSRDSSRVRIVSSVSWCHGMYRKSVPTFFQFSLACFLKVTRCCIHLRTSLLRWRQRINCTIIIIIITRGVGVPRRKPHSSLASSQLSRIQVRALSSFSKSTANRLHTRGTRVNDRTKTRSTVLTTRLSPRFKLID